ncbi:head GIN domain-containing protein [Sediminibacterium sp.]|uniref:head GIN domain-containing protein n=1 Tax=Sediminibacterium sp. TaxID=1917865 RepID=UPI003F6EDF53
MKKLVLLASIILLAMGTYAQKTVAESNAQKRAVKSFHSIDVSSGIKVMLTKSDNEELAVAVGDPAYLEYIETTVKDGVLKITREQDWKFWNQWKNWKVTVYLSYKDLKSIKANSGANITGADLSFNNLEVKMSSGAFAELEGRTNSLNVDVSSGAMFKGYNLTTNTCESESSSGGGVQVNVSKELNAKASSGGSIRYKGEGLIRDIKVSSGGTVKRF